MCNKFVCFLIHVLTDHKPQKITNGSGLWSFVYCIYCNRLSVLTLSNNFRFTFVMLQLMLSTIKLLEWPYGAMVARLTPDQKVGCSSHSGVSSILQSPKLILSMSHKKNNFGDFQKKLTPGWLEHPTFWSGVRRATIAP